ncbi:Glucose-6-phosphate isomerase [subsurface metagenome]
MDLQIRNGRVVIPFFIKIDPKNGKMTDYDTHIERYLSKLIDMFVDSEAAKAFLKKNGETLIYEVYEKDIPEVNGEIRYCSSVTYPGKIGDEYFMSIITRNIYCTAGIHLS